jgi:hypothetical protein
MTQLSQFYLRQTLLFSSVPSLLIEGLEMVVSAFRIEQDSVARHQLLRVRPPQQDVLKQTLLDHCEVTIKMINK